MPLSIAFIQTEKTKRRGFLDSRHSFSNPHSMPDRCLWNSTLEVGAQLALVVLKSVPVTQNPSPMRWMTTRSPRLNKPLGIEIPLTIGATSPCDRSSGVSALAPVKI